jgi:hypothetical protein
VRPSASAVMRFTTRSNLVGCSTGIKLELGGLLDRQVGGLGAPEDLNHDGPSLPPHRRKTGPVGHETPGLRVFFPLVDGRKPVLGRKIDVLPVN